VTFDFKGRRVVVCGGSRGIGRAIALEFASAGAAVSICARGEDTLRATEKDIAAHGGVHHAASCDLADAESIAAYVNAAAAALGGIDVLVNNGSAFALTDDDESWLSGARIDVLAIVRATRAALPFLERADFASVINISSISGLRPSVRTPSYAAVKAASIHYTTSQAAALAGKKIRVNCIAPGAVEFPGGVWDKRRADAPELYERTLKSIPFGRMGTPEEIAEVALFLASRHARWITGQTIAVDGGQLLA